MEPMKTSSNRIDLAEACTRFEKLAHRELQRGMLTGVSVAWVDDQRIVYLKGFGLADPQRNVAARPDTVYRAGSISKLFTAVAAMQLAEQGKLDIDRPVTDYAPQFRIVVPFEDAGPITPRLLMGHRAGMIRESPVGGYFDPNEPTLDATVASTADCVLVHRPGTVTKYSNIGASVNGWLVEKITGTPFPNISGGTSSSPWAWSIPPSSATTTSTGAWRTGRCESPTAAAAFSPPTPRCLNWPLSPPAIFTLRLRIWPASR